MFVTNYETDDKVTLDTLRRGQVELAAHDRVPRVEGWARPGLLVGLALDGGLDERWLPTFDGGSVVITAPTVQITGSLASTMSGRPLTPGTAALSGALYLVDGEGRLVELDTTIQGPVEIPDDGVWRTLIAKSVETTRERGTLSFTTGSTTVVGDGTTFTKLTSLEDGPNPTVLRVDEGDSANGNEGKYEVAEIVSDTELVLRLAPEGTTESGVPFHVESRAYNRALSGHAQFSRYVVELALISRAITSAEGFVLADVRSLSGVGAVVDRRAGSLYQPAPATRGGVILAPHFDTVTGDVEVFEDLAASAAAGCFAMSAAPTATGTLWAIARTGIKVLDAVNLNHGELTAGSPVAISSTAGSDSPAIVKLCDGGAYTHLVVYHRGGVIYARRTADSGATWTSEVAIWTPSAAASGASASEPDAVCLLNGRVVVVGTHDDGAGLTTFRYVFSDDQGSTWDNSDDEGHTWIAQLNFGVATSVTAPRITQGADGRIWTCWINSWGTVGWLTSASADTLAKELHPGSTLGGQITPSTSAERPDIVAGPDGSAFVVWIDKYPTSHTEVWGAPLIGDGTAAPRRRRLLRIDAGAGSAGDHHLHLYGTTGAAMLAYNTAGASTIQVNLVTCDLVRTT